MVPMNERRFYEIAGITVQVESDLPFADDTFDVKFESFRRDAPGPDTVVIRHHFELPAEDLKAGGEEIYRQPPWAIWRMPDGSWVYEGIAPEPDDLALHRVALFDGDHTRGELYNPRASARWWADGGLGALTLFPSDQIWLAQLLADRDACYLHSGGMILNGLGGPSGVDGADRQGVLFVGHSDAGKSTTMELVKRGLGERAEILCDDRNIVRRWPDGHAGDGSGGFYAHGTWSHGDVPDVSAAGAPLRAILFLEQSRQNEIVPLTNRKVLWQRLLATLIRPMVTAEWMHKEMDVLQGIVHEVPCYTMRFDRSGAIVPELEELVTSRPGA